MTFKPQEFDDLCRAILLATLLVSVLSLGCLAPVLTIQAPGVADTPIVRPIASRQTLFQALVTGCR